jgi:hypothetical protein
MYELAIITLLFFSLAVWSKVQVYRLQKIVTQKEEEYKRLLNQKKSSEVRTGQISEQLAPFLAEFKYNPKRAHFLGQPIDYIIFGDDVITFLEVKSGMAQLNPVQKSIKDLIINKKVAWDEMRIDGKNQNKPGACQGDNVGDIVATVQTTPNLQGETKTDSKVPVVFTSISGSEASTI